MEVNKLVSRVLKDKSGLRWRIASGVFWAFVATAVSQASGLLRAILPARILGVDPYGQFVTLQSTLGLFASFAGLGLGTTATKYVSQLRHTDPERAGRILGFCSILTTATAGLLSVALLLFAGKFSELVFGNGALAPELQIGALYVFFFTINGYQIGALAGFEAFSTLAWATILQSALSIVIMFGLTWSWKLPGAMLALGITALMAWIIQGIALRRQSRMQGIQISYSGVSREGRVFREFVLPAALSGMLGGVVAAGGNALLVRQPNGLVQAAIFGAATTIRSIALFAPGVLTRVTLPVLSNLQGNQSHRSFRRTFWSSLSLSGGFTLVAGILLFAVAPWLLRLFGEEYLVGRAVVGLALASAVLEIVAVNLFQVLYSHGRIWANLAITAVWATVILGVTMVLAPQYGAAGLALSYLLAWACSSVSYGFVTWRLLSPGDEGATRRTG